MHETDVTAMAVVMAMAAAVAVAVAVALAGKRGGKGRSPVQCPLYSCVIFARGHPRSHETLSEAAGLGSCARVERAQCEPAELTLVRCSYAREGNGHGHCKSGAAGSVLMGIFRRRPCALVHVDVTICGEHD